MIFLLLFYAQEPVESPPWLTIGGRLHADYVIAGGHDLDDIGPTSGSDAEIRRARLRFDLRFAETLRGRLDFDFARGETRPREIALSWLPEAGSEWKAGFVKVPFGFERMMSSNDFDYAEESSAGQAIAPGRRTGLFHTSWTPDWTASGAAYMVSNSRAEVDRGTWGLATRGVWRPWRDDSEQRLVHLGASMSWEEPDGETSFSSNPEQHLLDDFLDSGGLATNAFGRVGVEAAAVFGPVHGSAEWFGARPDDPDGGVALVQGWALSAGAFLTGESRSYDDAKASYARTEPLLPFDPGDSGSGPGAWELVARLGHLDLDSTAAFGDPAAMDVWSAGCVWHWTPHLRWLFTVSRIELDGFDAVHALTVRFSFDW